MDKKSQNQMFLYNTVKEVEKDLGIKLGTWRSILDHCSQEWTNVSDTDRLRVYNWLKDGKGSTTLEDVKSNYIQFNDLHSNSHLNKYIDESIAKLRGPEAFLEFCMSLKEVV